MTQPKRGRPSTVPDLDQVIVAIAVGKYDDRLIDLGFAIDERREFLKGQLLDQVRKLFGSEAAEQIVEKPKPGVVRKPAVKANPFVEKSKRDAETEQMGDELTVGTSLVESLNQGERPPIELRGAIIGGLSSSDIAD